MPPTFFYFLGFLVYLALAGVTTLIFGPMLFSKGQRKAAKKAFAVVLTSFPCLLCMSFVWTVIFGVPGFLLLWIMGEGNVPLFLVIPGLYLYVMLVASTSLYVWYLVTKILWGKIEGTSIKDMLHQKKVLRNLKLVYQKYRAK